jgi:deazaflavin-dependent oxidoreductase (nitroreductase family)
MAPHTRMWQARHFVTRFVNPVTRLFAGWAPGFGIVIYEGRRTGRTYHTPINVLPRGDDYVFVLTYGSDAEWVKNVQAAGECRIRTRGRERKLVDPKLIVDPTRRLAPRFVRFIGRLGNVTEFLRMHAA